jgi:colicin import membrane protein
MKNEVIEHNAFSASIKFNVTLEQAKKMFDECKKLELKDWQDEETYKLIRKERTKVNKVDEARHVCKRKLKEPADEHNRKVEALSKEIEFYTKGSSEWLTKQLKVRDDMLAKIKQEEEEREQREADRRMQLALSIGWDKPVYLIKALSLEDFDNQFQEAKAIYEDNQRIAEENKRKADEFQKAQQDRMDELERENKAMKAAQTETLKSEVEDARKAKEELARIETEKKEEAARLARAEAEAKKKAKDSAMFDEVKAAFPDLPSAWAEIVRLKKEVASNAF